MSNFRGHLFGASLFGVLYLVAFAALYAVDGAYAQFSAPERVAYPVALFGLCLLFGLWPDVDTNSVGQNIFYTVFFVADLGLILTEHYRESAFFGLAALLPILGKHRGWTHTWWAMLLVPAPMLVLPYLTLPERPLAGLPFYGAAVAGYASHLVFDGLLWRRRKRR